MDSPLILRPAEQRDAKQIAAIYGPIVTQTVISFELEPPSADDIAGRIESNQKRYPWLVSVANDQVLGYAYASEHRQRAAYQWSVDVTAYVAEAARRRGIGRSLYLALLKILKAQGFQSAYAGIALPNDASVGLHEAVGFKPLGVYKNVGFKLGAWRDVGWWGLEFGAAGNPPAEPVNFCELRAQPSFRIS